MTDWVETSWFLSDALPFIGKLQPGAMESGWCLMLGGGVLNRGYSPNDLDLLAYPRTRESRVENLLPLLPEGEWSETPVSRVYSFPWQGKKVELIFQTWSPPCP